MKISLQTVALLFAASSILLCAAGADVNGEQEISDAIKLNKATVENIDQLIKNGRFVNDRRGEWQVHRPSVEEENRFIQAYGYAEYAKWHLGIDESHAPNTKARYKFPCGDFKNVHRCALLAAQNRANQFNHRDIENAAIYLRKLIEIQGDPRPRQ
jgi:hypothetical protein